MHEQSLVRALLKEVDQVRCQHGAARVSVVRVEIGALSGVEPMLLATAFEQLATARTVSGAELVIDEVALRAECKSCDCEFEVNNFVFRCPTCGGNVRVTCGDELHLVSVSLCEASSETRELLNPSLHESGYKTELLS